MYATRTVTDEFETAPAANRRYLNRRRAEGLPSSALPTLGSARRPTGKGAAAGSRLGAPVLPVAGAWGFAGLGLPAALATPRPPTQTGAYTASDSALLAVWAVLPPSLIPPARPQPGAEQMCSRPRLPRRPVIPSLSTRALAALRPALASQSPPLWVQSRLDPSPTPAAPDSADPAHLRSPVPPRLPGQPSSKTPPFKQKLSLVEAEPRKAVVIVLPPSPGQGGGLPERRPLCLLSVLGPAAVQPPPLFTQLFRPNLTVATGSGSSFASPHAVCEPDAMRG